MKDVDYKLVALTGYVTYLLSDKYKVYNRLNKGHIKKLDKLLKSFCKEYTKDYWGWK